MANLADDINDTKKAKIIRSMQLTGIKARAYRKYKSINTDEIGIVKSESA